MENHEKTTQDQTSTADPTLDQSEVDRFGGLAAKWWDPDGEFRPLHRLGPARLGFIRDEISGHFAAAESDQDEGQPSSHPPGLRPLQGLSALDIGCGGGLICEPLARMGAAVTGIDPAEQSIKAARQHALSQRLDIDYQARRAEDLVNEGKTFDAVLCLEVVEHVPDVGAFIKAIAPLVRPGGIMILSTINRTVKSYGLAIVGAEYVLRWMPVGTHQWERFVTPDELARYATTAGLTPKSTKGLVYDLVKDRWDLGTDTDVNYMMSAIGS